MLLPDKNDSQDEQGKINHEDTYHSRQQIVQQFHHLSRIGGHEIQEHIHRYHSCSEEIEQNQLEGGKKDKDKCPPHHLTRTSGYRKEPHIQRQRQQHIGCARPERQSFGKAQGDVGQQQCHYRIPVKEGARRHLIIYRINYRIAHRLYLIIYIASFIDYTLLYIAHHGNASLVFRDKKLSKCFIDIEEETRLS